MTVTLQLLELFRVDKMLRGLKSRLEASERFLSQQQKLMTELDAQKSSLEAQARQLRAGAANDEGEAARIGERIATIREQMNTAKNSREYNAFLTELNTFKDEKTAAEERALASMSKIEETDTKLAEVKVLHDERARIMAGAIADRDTKAAEIKGRVDELAAQRKALAEKLTPEVLRDFEGVVHQRGDEAMAIVEITDRRSHEGSCSACMMTVPIEIVSGVRAGKLIKCPTCHCFLYFEPEIETPKPSRKKKAAAEA